MKHESFSSLVQFKEWIKNYGSANNEVYDLEVNQVYCSLNMFSTLYDERHTADFGWKCEKIELFFEPFDDTWTYIVKYREKNDDKNSTVIVVTVNEKGEVTEESQYLKLQQFHDVEDFCNHVANKCTCCTEIDNNESVRKQVLDFVWKAKHFEELFGVKCDGVELSYAENTDDWRVEFICGDNSLFFDSLYDVEVIKDYSKNKH